MKVDLPKFTFGKDDLFSLVWMLWNRPNLSNALYSFVWNRKRPVRSSRRTCGDGKNLFYCTRLPICVQRVTCQLKCLAI